MEDAPRSDHEIWGFLDGENKERQVMEALHAGNLILATDGSNRCDEGAMAWCCANKESRHIIVKGRRRVRCARSDSSSLRPELDAIYGAIQYVEDVIKRFHDEQVGNVLDVPIYTDSANAISDMEHSLLPSTKNVFENNIDMKIRLKETLRKSKIQFHLEYVKAHQDRDMPFDDLPFPAQLNCVVDEYASGVYNDNKCGQHEDLVPFFPEQICALTLPFVKPTTNIVEQLLSFANGHNTESQLARYWNIPEKWLGNIEWKGLRSALRRERNSGKGMLCKLLHKQWPTMKLMKRNGLSSIDTCPICCKEVETWDHVFQCKHQAARAERQVRLGEIKTILVQRQTHPVLQNRILAMIQQWTGGFPITVNRRSEHNMNVEEAFHDQRILGFGNFFCGVVSKCFGEIQDEYYQQLEVRKAIMTKNEWNVMFIRELLTYSQAIWKFRCDWMHNTRNGTIESQIRDMAMNLRNEILANPWKIRNEDVHLLRRNAKFIFNGSIIQIQQWIDRVITSVNIAINHDIATRQDLKKWLH